VELVHDPSVGSVSRYREQRWVERVLGAWGNGPRPRRVVVLSVQRQQRWASLPEEPQDDVLVIALGGEHGRRLPSLKGWRVARCYASGGPDFGLPLGPSGFLPDLPAVPWSDRTVPLCFVGWLHPGRAALYRLLSGRRLPGPLPALLRGRLARDLDGSVVSGSVLRFQLRFGAGMGPEDYGRLLGRSRVALVPRGTRQVETFRHHEAARAGCVLVGDGYAGGPPVLPLPETLAELRQLTEESRALKQHHAQVRAWWQEQGRAEAVAARLARWWSAGGGLGVGG
jgi:hypothetical protein